MGNYYLLIISNAACLISLIEMVGFRSHGWHTAAGFHAGFALAFLLAALICWRRVKRG